MEYNNIIIKKIYITFIFLFLMSLSLYSKEILILHSYHETFVWTNEIQKGLEDSFKGKNFSFHIEYMDTKRVYSEKFLDLLKNFYMQKYKNINFDLIISSDDNALNFLEKYKNKIFKNNPPVVFCGVNNKNKVFKDKYTGVLETYELNKTILLLLKLHPNLSKLYIVGGGTTTGLILKKEVKKIMKIYNNLDIEYLSIESKEKLGQQLSALDKNAVIFMLTFFRDEKGRFLSEVESIKLLTKLSQVPVYSTWEFYMGKGIVGGVLNNGYDQGIEAGSLALRILNGEKNVSIIKQKKSKYMLDYNILKKFNINMNLIPKNVIIKNQNMQLNKGLLIFIFLFTLFIIIVIFLWFVEKFYLEKKLLKDLIFRIKASKDLIVLLSKNNTIKFINDSYSKLLGYESFNLIGFNFDNLIETREKKTYHICQNGELLSVLLTKVFFLKKSNLSIITTVNTSEYLRKQDKFLESKKRYKAILENQFEAICVWNLDSSITFFNERFSKIFIKDKNEIKNIKWFDFILEEDKSSFNNLLEQIIKQKKNSRIEHKMLNKLGEKLWFKWYDTFIYDSKGNIIEVQSVGRDITEEVKIKKLINVHYDLSVSLNSVSNLKNAIRLILEYISEINEVISVGFYTLEFNKLILIDSKNLSDNIKREIEHFHLDKNLNKVVEKNKAIYITNKEFLKLYNNPRLKTSLEQKKIESLGLIPISFNDKSLGSLFFSYSHSKIPDEVQNIMETIGIQMAEVIFRIEAQEQAQVFKKIADEANYGVRILNEAGDITYINKYSSEVHNYNDNELLGKNTSLILKGDSKKEVIELLKKLEDGKKLKSEENWHITKDGRFFAVLTSAFMIKNNNHKIFAVTSLDLREQKKIQENLKESKTRLKLALEIGKHEIWEWYLKEDKIVFSKSFLNLLGFQNNETYISKKLWYSIVHPDDIISLSEEIYNHLKGFSDDFNIEYRLFTKDKEIKWFMSHGRIVERNKEGNPLKIIAIHTEISKIKKSEELLKSSEEKLIKTNESKDKLLSIIAHDLRGPIGNLSPLLSLLRDDIKNGAQEEVEDVLKELIKASDAIYDLLENLLTWAKNQKNEVKFKLEIINLYDIINENLNLLAGNAYPKNITLSLDIPKEIFILADNDMINVVIRNLISNSIKFTKIDGNIKIKYTDNLNFHTISITDTGIGIPKNILKDIFKISNNFIRNGTLNETGSGLGLVLCKEFVEKNNGTISVDSEEGVGTTFKINLKKH